MRYQSAAEIAATSSGSGGTPSSAAAGRVRQFDNPAGRRSHCGRNCGGAALGWTSSATTTGAVLFVVFARPGLPLLAVALWHRPAASPRVTAVRQVTHDRDEQGSDARTDGSRGYYTADGWAPLDLVAAGAGDGRRLRAARVLRAPTFDPRHPARAATSCWSTEVYPRLPRRPGLDHSRRWGATRGPSGAWRPPPAAWTAGGQQVALHERERTCSSLEAMGPAHGRLLTAPARGPAFRRLSPDGQRLRYAVVGREGGDPALWEASVRRERAHIRSSPAGARRAVSWTPDGRYYVFHATPGGEASPLDTARGGAVRALEATSPAAPSS